MHPAASQTGLQQGADNCESHCAPGGPLPAGNDPMVNKVPVQVARSPALRDCLAFVYIHSTASSWDPSEKHMPAR